MKPFDNEKFHSLLKGFIERYSSGIGRFHRFSELALKWEKEDRSDDITRFLEPGKETRADSITGLRNNHFPDWHAYPMPTWNDKPINLVAGGGMHPFNNGCVRYLKNVLLQCSNILVLGEVLTVDKDPINKISPTELQNRTIDFFTVQGVASLNQHWCEKGEDAYISSVAVYQPQEIYCPYRLIIETSTTTQDVWVFHIPDWKEGKLPSLNIIEDNGFLHLLDYLLECSFDQLTYVQDVYGVGNAACVSMAMLLAYMFQITPKFLGREGVAGMDEGHLAEHVVSYWQRINAESQPGFIQSQGQFKLAFALGVGLHRYRQSINAGVPVDRDYWRQLPVVRSCDFLQPKVDSGSGIGLSSAIGEEECTAEGSSGGLKPSWSREALAELDDMAGVYAYCAPSIGSGPTLFGQASGNSGSAGQLPDWIQSMVDAYKEQRYAEDPSLPKKTPIEDLTAVVVNLVGMLPSDEVIFRPVSPPTNTSKSFRVLR